MSRPAGLTGAEERLLHQATCTPRSQSDPASGIHGDATRSLHPIAHAHSRSCHPSFFGLDCHIPKTTHRSTACVFPPARATSKLCPRRGSERVTKLRGATNAIGASARSSHGSAQNRASRLRSLSRPLTETLLGAGPEPVAALCAVPRPDGARPGRSWREANATISKA